MAFQYRNKRRPNMLQTALSSFAKGARTGYFKGKEQTLQKAVAAKEKDEKDRKAVIDQLKSVSNNVYDTGIKLNIDKLIFDIGTGVKPISEAYALIQTLTPGAYEKPDTQAEIDRANKQENIDLDKQVGAWEKPTIQKSGMAGMAGRIPTPTEIAKRKAESKARQGEPDSDIVAAERDAMRTRNMEVDPAVSAKLKELNNLNVHIDKLYNHATNPKNEKGYLGWMTREDYVSKYLDPEIKGEHDKLMSEISQLKPQPEVPYNVPQGRDPALEYTSGQHTRGYLSQGVQTMLSTSDGGFQVGKMYTTKGGKRYEYLGGDPYNSSSWREVG